MLSRAQGASPGRESAEEQEEVLRTVTGLSPPTVPFSRPAWMHRRCSEEMHDPNVQVRGARRPAGGGGWMLPGVHWLSGHVRMSARCMLSTGPGPRDTE